MSQPENNTDRQLRRLFQEVKRQDQATVKSFDEFMQIPASTYRAKYPGWVFAAVVALLVAGGAYLLVPSNPITRQSNVAVDFEELFNLVDQEFEAEMVAQEDKVIDQHLWTSTTDSLLAINFALQDNHTHKSP